MKIFDNVTDIVRDDLIQIIKKVARFLLLPNVFLCMPIML